MATFTSANASYTIPNSGVLFVSGSNQGANYDSGTIQIRDGNSLKSFDIRSLVPQLNASQVQQYWQPQKWGPLDTGANYYLDANNIPHKIDNANQLIQEAAQRLKAQTGIDYYALPGMNMADAQQAILSSGGNQAQIGSVTDLQSFLTKTYGGDQNIDIRGQTGGAVGTQTVTTPSGATVTIPNATQPVPPSGTTQGTALPNNGGAAPTASPPPVLATNQQTTQPTTQTGSATPPTTSLQPGSEGAAVQQLQNWLVSQGYMTQAQVNTGYGTYGPQTTAAVAKWQSDHGVNTQGNPGYYGPITMAAINGSTQPQSGTSGGTSTTGTTGGTSGGNTVTLPNGAQVTLDAQGNITGGNPTAGTTNPDLTGLPPEWQALYTQLDTYLKKLQANGQTINPNVTITPEKLQEFATQAANEIDPYYANLLKTNVSDFMYGLGYSRDQILNNEQLLQQQYGRDVRSLQSNLADQGFAQSGARRLQEQQLADTTQNTINTNRAQLGYNANTAARSLAGAFGTSNVPQFSLSGAPTVGAGETNFGRSLGDTPLYSLSDSVYQGLKGTKQFEQEAAKRTRTSDLESAFRSNLALQQQRSLTI